MYFGSGLGRARGLGALGAPRSLSLGPPTGAEYLEPGTDNVWPTWWEYAQASAPAGQVSPALITGTTIDPADFAGGIASIGWSAEGGAFVQSQSGELVAVAPESPTSSMFRPTETLLVVPGMVTPQQADAARAVQEELAALAAAGPIPEGFFLDPAVQAEWEARNEGGTWWDRMMADAGADDASSEEAARAGLPLLLGLGLLGAFLVTRRKRRS